MDRFEQRGVEIWAISPDSVADLEKYASKKGITFPLLSDPDLSVISRWGLVNPSNPGVPHPTAVIVDGSGTITYVRQDVDFRQRPSAKDLLKAFEGTTEP